MPAAWCFCGLLVLVGVDFAFRKRDGFDLFSPHFFIGMSLSLFYGVMGMIPLLREEFGPYSALIEENIVLIPQAAEVSFYCLIAFIVGYRYVWRGMHLRPGGFLTRTVDEATLRMLWACCFVLGAAALGIGIASNVFFQASEPFSPLLQTIVGNMFQGFAVAVVLSVFQALRLRSKFWRIAAAVSIAVFLGFGIPSGSKTLAVIGVILTLLAWNYARARISRRATVAYLVAGAVAVAVLFPVSVVYRESLQASGAMDQQSVANAASAIEMMVDEVRSLSADSFLALSVDYLSARLSNVGVVAMVLRHFENGGELLWGKTYGRFFYAFIPRFIWPDKPAISTSREVAVVLGYGDAEEFQLGEPISSTSIGITLVGELLLNFPAWLAPVGMVFIGFLYRWMYETFLAGLRTSPALAVSVYGVWWYVVLYTGYESNLAAVLSGAVKITVALLILVWLLEVFRRALAPTVSAGVRTFRQ
jgi:hypothetical protein